MLKPRADRHSKLTVIDVIRCPATSMSLTITAEGWRLQ